MNILLTGGAGYIGSHVVLSLIDSGHKVHIIDNLSTGNKKLIPKEVNFTECNVNDTNEINRILKNNKFDLLMHFAGFIKVEESVNFPDKYFLNNTENAIKLFKTCKKNGLKNIVFSSTAAAYGNNQQNNVNEKNRLNPKNPYAESKIKTENFLIENQNNFNFIILRYFNVAGADQKLRSGQISDNATHLIKIISELAVGKRKEIEVYGNDYKTTDGTPIRDYIHVSDLADIHVEVAKYLMLHNKSQVFNCGYGKGYSVLEVIRSAAKICNKTLNYRVTNRRKGDVEKLVADISKISKHINWKPKHDDIKTIIKSSIEWEKKLNEKNF